MKVLIAGSIYADCCYEEKLLISALMNEFKKMGHQCDNFAMPMVRDVIYSSEAITFTQFVETDIAEMLVTVGYPACFLPHSRKCSFIFDTDPMLFEYMGTNFGIKNSAFYKDISNYIVHAETTLLPKCRKIFCGSIAMQNDLKVRSGIKSEVFYLPNMYEECISATVNVQNYFVAETDLFAESRINILLEAFKLNDSDTKLLLFVPRSGRLFMDALQKLIKQLGLESKVVLIEEILSLDILKKAKGYISMNYEKRRISNGLMRAAGVGCPLIIANDAGAELELGTMYETLNIVEPEPNYVNNILKHALLQTQNCELTRPVPVSDLAKKMVFI